MAEATTSEVQYACTHYKRQCKLLAPCCNRFYSCHICHNQNEDHLIIVTKILKHLCTSCDELQLVNSSCSKCGIKFAEYACVLCYMFDDNNKKQFHCADCGICRVGGGGNFFHCKKCNMCLGLHLKNNHKCVDDYSYIDCSYCFENLQNSRLGLGLSSCGHLVHASCYQKQKICSVCK